MEGHPGYVDFHDGKWVVVSSYSFRTIGNAQSGADIRHDWLFKLFSLIYGQYGTAIYTATGQLSTKTTVESDWNAAKRLALPDFRGRVLMGNGRGQAGVNRTLGQSVGAETHTLSIAEMPSHAHATPAIGRTSGYAGNNTAGFEYGDLSQGFGSGITSTGAGSGQAHNNLQPSIVQTLFMSAGVF